MFGSLLYEETCTNNLILFVFLYHDDTVPPCQFFQRPLLYHQFRRSGMEQQLINDDWT